MKSRPGMRRTNAAIKGCHRCKKLVPTATRYCRCGYDFKKPNPDSRGAAASTTKASTSAASSTSTPTAKAAVQATSPTESRRKSERRQRITVKPDFYSPSDYENPFKKVRRRTASDTSMSDDGNLKRKRGRPKQGLASGFVKPSIKPHAKTDNLKTEPPGTPNGDSKDGANSKKERETEPIDPYASIPPEKHLQYAILLAEINRKIGIQTFRPT